jgi:hypothetical protein
MKKGEIIKLVLINIFRISLLASIIYLSSNGLDGWGWLIFILFLTL